MYIRDVAEFFIHMGQQTLPIHLNPPYTYCRFGVIGIFHSALPLSQQCKQFYGNAQRDISRAARFVSYQNVIYTCNNSLTHIKEVQYHSMRVTKNRISNERSCAFIQKGLGSNRLIGSLYKLSYEFTYFCIKNMTNLLVLYYLFLKVTHGK